MPIAIWTIEKYNEADRLYPAILSLCWNVFKDWPEELGVKRKTILKDKVDPSYNNIAIIRIEVLQWMKKERRGNFHFEKDALPLIQWCLDKNIKVVIDDCWEIGSIFPNERGEVLKDYWSFVIENNIKILSNAPPIEDNYVFDTYHDNSWKLYDNSHKNVFLDSKYFLFQMRQHHLRDNFHFRMNNYPTLHKDKKYLYTCLFGNIAKVDNAFLYASLLKNNLIGGDSFTSAILQKFDPIPIKKDKYDKEYHEIIDWIDNYKDDVYKHRPFEDQYGPEYNDIDITTERRIPQQLYDSHFAINVETTMHPWFWTEKTFKCIIAKIPFLSYGGPYHSSGLRRYYGFERFEEIFDYSYEDQITSKSKCSYILIEGILENIKRLKKEPVSIFNQPSVREKLDYNESLFYKLTTTQKIKEHVKNIIEVVK